MDDDHHQLATSGIVFAGIAAVRWLHARHAVCQRVGQNPMYPSCPLVVGVDAATPQFFQLFDAGFAGRPGFVALLAWHQTPL